MIILIQYYIPCIILHALSKWKFNVLGVFISSPLYIVWTLHPPPHQLKKCPRKLGGTNQIKMGPTFFFFLIIPSPPPHVIFFISNFSQKLNRLSDIPAEQPCQICKQSPTSFWMTSLENAIYGSVPKNVCKEFDIHIHSMSNLWKIKSIYSRIWHHQKNA